MRWITETETRNESIFSHKVFIFRYIPLFRQGEQLRPKWEMSTYFHIKFSDSDILHLFQIRWMTETETRNEFIFSEEVFRFRYSPLTFRIRWTTETQTRNEFICSFSIVIFNYCHPLTDHLYEYMQFTRCNLYFLSSSFSLAIVVTFQLTVFMTTSTSQYTILSKIFSALKLRQFLQYLPKHAL